MMGAEPDVRTNISLYDATSERIEFDRVIWEARLSALISNL